MKKVVTIAVLTCTVIMLELNLLKPLFENAYMWVEGIIGFSVIIAMLLWNGKQDKK